MKIINFAHGDFLMLGMYFAFFLSVMFGIDPYLSALLCLPVFFALGWVVQVLFDPAGAESAREHSDSR